jgi:hypothetical protein
VGNSRGAPSLFTLYLRSGPEDSCRYFAGEIIGNVLDLEPRRWMRPRRIEYRQSKDRIQRLKKKYEKYDWTGMIGES